MRVAIFVSSIVLVVVAAAAVPMSGPAEALTKSAATQQLGQDAYGR